MVRVWALAGGFFLILLVLFLGESFFGENTLKFGAVMIGTGFAAAYLPGGVALSRGIYLFVGVLLAAVGFLIGSLAFADNPQGVFMGGVVPLVLAAIVAMWSRKQEVFITIMLGAGALTAFYTTSFFTDPQGINYQLPIVLGGVMAPLGIAYLVAAIFKTFVPNKPKEVAAEPVEQPLADAPAGSDASTSADSTKDSNDLISLS